MDIQNFFKTILTFMSLSILIMLGGCEDKNDLIEISDENNEWNIIELTFNVFKTPFVDDPETRASDQWTNGSKVYLTFTAGSFVSYGNAVYNNGTWILSYNGKLGETGSTTCAAVYFEDIEAEHGTSISLSPHTAVYEDGNCSYNFQNGKLSITANLKPKTGRIRFAGLNNSKIKVFGISHYSSFDYASGKFISSNGAINTSVSGDYTPYIYGEFADVEQPRLNLITASSAFTRFPSTPIYKPGESGYMTIPSESSHNLWTNAAIFKVNGVEFTMIPVTYSNGNFLLAETETTEQFYNAVTGDNPTTSQIPKTGCSYEEWDAFTSKLSGITGLEFRMPNREEWQYAFEGGDKSKGYTYSGSNVISNVAWYVGNSNSKSHEVKQLHPNELGLYDMSGNVCEVTTTVYGSSSHYWCGGSYSSIETSCKISSYEAYFDQSGTIYGGLRLALSNN